MREPNQRHESDLGLRPWLSSSWLRAARMGWYALALAVLVILLTSLPVYGLKFGGMLDHIPDGGSSPSGAFFAPASAIASLAAALLSIVLAWIIFKQRFGELVPAILSYYLLLYGVVMAGPLEGWGMYWFGDARFAVYLQSLLFSGPTILLLGIFPNGKFYPHWMRWVTLLSIPWSIFLFFVPVFDSEYALQNPSLTAVVAAWFTLFMVTGLYSQVRRYQSLSTTEEKQQTKWVLFGFSLWMAYILLSSGPYYYLQGLPSGANLPWWVPASELGWWLSLNILPVTITIAITRYRLWNIDLVINRTLVYGGLTLAVVGLYILVVGGLGLLFRTSDSFIFPLVATGLAAVLVQPLRDRLQRSVNRLMYGERDDPVAILSRLGDQLERTGTPEATLEGIVATVAQALKLPYVAIEWGEEGEIVASFGIPGDGIDRFALLYQGLSVGQLLVGRRAPEEVFSGKDQRLLENIAQQAGAVVFNAHLTHDLIRARERLVNSQEEERRRIRRDLHDGLGPELASLTLKIDAAQNLLRSDPQAAEMLLTDLKGQVQGAIGEIRRLVYNLRPPALDELGLVSALRERAAAFSPGEGPVVRVDGPDSLPPLPAAVEVAAYRIAQEAINNAARHGHAKHCWVRLQVSNELALEIIDDGCGLPPELRAGVGITSMRERTSEVGGRFSIEPARNGGTRVAAWMPIEAARR